MGRGKGNFISFFGVLIDVLLYPDNSCQIMIDTKISVKTKRTPFSNHLRFSTRLKDINISDCFLYTNESTPACHEKY
jgi:hypothetical protein